MLSSLFFSCLTLFLVSVFKKRKSIPPCDNHVSIETFSFVVVSFSRKKPVIPPFVINRRLLKTHPIQHEASIFVVTPVKSKNEKAKKQKPKVWGMHGRFVGTTK